MSQPLIIGITGYKGAGKDEVARVLAGHGYQRIGFADPLKAMALAVDPIIAAYGGRTDYKPEFERLSEIVEAAGWEGAKQYPEVRRFLQRLGTEGVRDQLGEDAWIRALYGRVARAGRYAIADVRFPNEADAIRSWGGVVWRVVRPGTTSDGHPSETSVDGINPDRTIPNVGTLKDLEYTVRRALTEIRVA